MRQPPGYEDQSLPDHMCLLKLSLYGLKQAPRAWFTRLHDFLVSVGFAPLKTDVSLFIYSRDNVRLYFLVYVDDILIMGSDSDCVIALINKLALEFKDILKRAAMVDCKPVVTPVSTAKTSDDVATPYADPTQYRSLAGVLQYLTVTRPDLSHAVNLLCQHMHAPTCNIPKF
ncbi:PREDICTED: uncharacterized protein LOC109149924 [Ipomoea nil]|uniref:uncharacterized protein LOC109149924 n=1 Tax=Ipomoea nil TaxID=35883 RepID=UPI0009016D4D|nr:PREDICTED: uncharacterized protein LOC109149924 [Ipomoea nil]